MYRLVPEPDPKKLPLNHALLWILVSTLLISGSVFMGWLYYLHVRELRLQDNQYNITTLVQKVLPSNQLKTSYLAELLDLSVDRPLNLYQFNSKEGEKRLNISPLIQRSNIRKIRPNALLIDYQMREPLAYLGDCTNTAIDEQGVIFPYRPFYPAKNLPTIYLNLNAKDIKWGDSLKNHELMQCVFSFLKNFKKLPAHQFFLKQLDVTNIDADSYGQREIVIVLEGLLSKIDPKNSFHLYLRLNPDFYQKNLIHFLTLVNQPEKIQLLKINKQNKILIIDLRLPFLAFIKQDE